VAGSSPRSVQAEGPLIGALATLPQRAPRYSLWVASDPSRQSGLRPSSYGLMCNSSRLPDWDSFAQAVPVDRHQAGRRPGCRTVVAAQAFARVVRAPHQRQADGVAGTARLVDRGCVRVGAGTPQRGGAMSRQLDGVTVSVVGLEARFGTPRR
jgi:hypothetical protein